MPATRPMHSPHLSTHGFPDRVDEGDDLGGDLEAAELDPARE